MLEDDYEDDPERARRRWNAYLDLIDAEIADEQLAAATISQPRQEAPPSPFVVDVGIYTSRADRDAIQAEQDRWTRLERLGR